jgi:hypothetical protein
VLLPLPLSFRRKIQIQDQPVAEFETKHLVAGHRISGEQRTEKLTVEN